MPNDSKSSTRRWRRRGGVLLVLAVLAAVAFVPVEARGRAGDRDDAARCRAKVESLWTALRYGQATASRFSEREVNAHLAAVLENNAHARQARGLTVGIDALRVDTSGKRPVLWVHGRLLGLPFALEYRAGVRRGESSGVRCTSARLGRLPLVPPFKWLAVSHLKTLLGGMRAEREILAHVSEWTLEEGSVRLRVKPASPSPGGSGSSS